MAVFFVKKRGWWRYEFEVNKIQYTKSGFKTKKEAQKALLEHKENIKNPPPPPPPEKIDITFGDLVESRLDYVKAYSCERHYRDYIYMARRWVKRWGQKPCSQITQDMIQQFIFERAESGSSQTGNKEIRFLKATFNHGKERKLLDVNPVDGIKFLPIEKKIKYIPPKEDVLRVLMAADQDVQDYLWAIKETLARMSEINQLTWEDVNLKERYIILYTRKKRGGNKTPRKVPMTSRLYDILERRFKHKNKELPWVFWHTYWSSKTGEKKEGPFVERKRIMKTLCKKAGVKYFRFHALRHLGASILDNAKVQLGSIQKILGHQRRTTTEIYLHSIGEAEREAIKVLEEEGGDLVDNLKTPHKTPHKNGEGLE